MGLMVHENYLNAISKKPVDLTLLERRGFVFFRKSDRMSVGCWLPLGGEDKLKKLIVDMPIFVNQNYISSLVNYASCQLGVIF